MRKLAAALIGAMLAIASTAVAAPPMLVAYVTDDNQDVYVALYGDIAVELNGCRSPAAARSLVALPGSAPIAETTLAALKAAHDLSHPRIPCSPEADFAADFPANTPVWIDLEQTRRFYMPSPKIQGLFYSIPGRCEAIMKAFAMRQRIALPGILRAEVAPPADMMGREITLDCGEAIGTPVVGGGMDSSVRWNLHRTRAVSSNEIYVAVYTHPDGIEKSYLPIHRINNAPASEAAWEGSNQQERVETVLKALFGIPKRENITDLKGSEVERLFTAPFLDLCLTACDGYQYQPAVFGAGLETRAAPVANHRLSALGEPVLRWEYAPGRAASFTGCDGLAAVMGMSAEGNPSADWDGAIAVTFDDHAAAATGFRCPVDAADLCLRSIDEGGVLSQAALTRTGCASAKHLRIELPEKARLADTLELKETGFASIEIVPKDPQGRSELTVSPPSTPGMASPPCLFEAVPAMIAVKGPVHLRMGRIDLIRGESDGQRQIIGLNAEAAHIALDHVTIGEGQSPIERAIRLCKTEFYSLGGTLKATAQALHAMDSRVAIGGTESDTATIISGSTGISMFDDGAMRLRWLALTAPRAIHLRNSKLKGKRVDLASGASGSGTALRLERGASSELRLSSARSFDCIGRLDTDSTARFFASTNELAGDNGRLSCGSRSVEVEL